MIVKLIALSSLLSLKSVVGGETCMTPENKTGECVSLKICPKLLQLSTEKTPSSQEFIKKSICDFGGGDVKVCCNDTSPGEFMSRSSTVDGGEEKNETKDVLRDRSFCGFQHSDDFAHRTNDTGINESPWIARLGYKLTDKDGNLTSNVSYLCLGSLINRRYVLTAASCQSPVDNSHLLEVQLGEFDVAHDTDCVEEMYGIKECNDPVKTYQIEKFIPHPDYKEHVVFDHAALIRLERNVDYTDYIRPICLPYSVKRLAHEGDILVYTGWGIKNTGDEVIIKKRVFCRVIANKECSHELEEFFFRNLPQKVRAQVAFSSKSVGDEYICTHTVENGIQSRHDLGAPLTFSNRLQWHQEGVLGYVQDAKLRLPAVYLRVEKYLDWIEENTEP